MAPAKVDPVVARCVDAWNSGAGDLQGLYAQTYGRGARTAYVNETATGACVVALPVNPNAQQAGLSVMAETPSHRWTSLVGLAVGAQTGFLNPQRAATANVLQFAQDLEARARDRAITDLNADGTLTGIAGANPGDLPQAPGGQGAAPSAPSTPTTAPGTASDQGSNTPSDTQPPQGEHDCPPIQSGGQRFENVRATYGCAQVRRDVLRFIRGQGAWDDTQRAFVLRDAPQLACLDKGGTLNCGGVADPSLQISARNMVTWPADASGSTASH